MTVSRRGVLRGAVGGVGSLALAGCGGGEPPRPALVGELADGALLRAHGGGGARARAVGVEEADVVVVGGGVAGLAAAWRLARAGVGNVVLLELADTLGGTAAAGSAPTGPFPWGAHYLTLPGPAARHVRAMLEDAGVILGYDADGRPAYDPFALCLAPGERVWAAGRWEEGLWPAGLATAGDLAAREAFAAEMARLGTWRGADGRLAFEIPVAASSRDPAVLALADRSFADWLDAGGYDGEVFRWWAAYACRDDFGTTPEETSAWAGLHYFAARRPVAADDRDLDTDVLTWPAGNGFLVDALAARGAADVRTGAVVHAVEADTGRVYATIRGVEAELHARHVVLAVPARMVDRLTGREPTPGAPDATPWRVAQLHVERLPAARGVPTAWDSVIYGSTALGYVTNTHQEGRYGGASVLTWYEALGGDPVARRRELLASTWEDAVDRVRADLRLAHPDLDAVLTRIDAWRWGHGTVRPVVGLHGGETLARLARPWGRVSVAHTELSGLSLFEEASWHGVRAAEEALDARGGLVGERFVPLGAEARGSG